MNAKELMIGNIVRDPYGKEITLTTVDADASMLSPIKLTDGWLLELGFRGSYETIDGKFIEKYDIEYHIVEKHYDRFFVNGSRVKYVHQLQNIFNILFGIELELVQP
jgi:hypothetical protein